MIEPGTHQSIDQDRQTGATDKPLLPSSSPSSLLSSTNLHMAAWQPCSSPLLLHSTLLLASASASAPAQPQPFSPATVEILEWLRAPVPVGQSVAHGEARREGEAFNLTHFTL
jgi:hypothetical protein